MRNPIRHRNIASSVLLLAVASATIAVVLWGHQDNPGMVFYLMFFSGAALAFPALYYTLSGIGHAREMNRMQRGEGIVARWTVDETTWRAFVKLNARLTEEQGLYWQNIGHIFETVPSDGIEVVVTDRAVCVGDDIQLLSGASSGILWADGPPPYMEFRGSYYSKSGVRRWALRFPTVPGAEGEAAKVRSHFTPHIKAYNPRIRRNIALIASAFFVSLFVAAFLLRGTVTPVEILVGMAVCSAIFGLASLFFASIWHIELRKRQRSNA